MHTNYNTYSQIEQLPSCANKLLAFNISRGEITVCLANIPSSLAFLRKELTPSHKSIGASTQQSKNFEFIYTGSFDDFFIYIQDALAIIVYDASSLLKNQITFEEHYSKYNKVIDLTITNFLLNDKDKEVIDENQSASSVMDIFFQLIAKTHKHTLMYTLFKCYLPLVDILHKIEKRGFTLTNKGIAFINKMTNSTATKIHTHLNQLSTENGRISSSDFSLQNATKNLSNTKLSRHHLKAREGYTLISVDYSQVELRILAHFCKDSNLLYAFRNNIDVHTLTASLIHNVATKKVNSEIRQIGKQINFSVIYGMGAKGFSEAYGFSLEDSKKFIKTFKMKYPRTTEYFEYVQKMAALKQYTVSLSGHKRYFPNFLNNYVVDGALLPSIKNSTIQTSAADLFRLALIEVDKDPDLKTLGAEILLPLHDEIILEAPIENAKQVAVRVQKIMEEIKIQGKEFAIPMTTEYAIGKVWGELK